MVARIEKFALLAKLNLAKAKSNQYVKRHLSKVRQNVTSVLGMFGRSCELQDAHQLMPAKFASDSAVPLLQQK